LTARDHPEVVDEGHPADDNGVPRSRWLRRRVRVRLSRAMFADHVPTPTAGELAEAAEEHAEITARR
jgi:hypothetical protein